jgi:hypothetical protein
LPANLQQPRFCYSRIVLRIARNQRMLVIEGGFTFDKINPIPFQLIENDLRFVGLDLSAPIINSRIVRSL